MARARILIAEDEKIVAIDLQNTLINLGYVAPVVVSSGEGAIETAEKIKPDLVLMDIVLKGNIDGIEAAAQIHRRFNIPVIYLTAYADPRTLERAKITEPFGYIIKPFEERELYTTIEMALYKHKMELLLKESEEKYKTLTENINVGIFRNTAGLEGKFIEANPAIIQMFGFKSREEFLNVDVTDLYQTPKDRKKFNKTILRKGFVKNEELKLKKKDGTPFIGSVSAVAVKNEDGKVEYYDGIIEDITERKQIEEMLLRSKTEWEATFDAMSDWVCMIDPKSRILRTNRAGEKFARMSAKEIVGESCCKLVHGSEERLPGCPVEKALHTRQQETMEFCLPEKDKCLMITADPVIEKDGNVVGVVHITRDIAERRQAEEKLRYQANMLENVSDAIISTDLDYKILTWNRAAQEMYGWKAGEVFGKSLYGVIKTEFSSGSSMDILAKLSTNEYWLCEVVQSRKDAKKINVFVSASALKDSDEKVIGVVLVNRNITELKQAEEKVKDIAKFPAEDPSPVLRIAKDGRILFANQASLSLLSEWSCQVGQSVPNSIRKIVNDTFALGEKKNVEIEHGDQVFLFSVAPVSNANYVNLYGIDITERKNVDAEIQRHLEMERTLAGLSERLVKAKRIDTAVNKALADLGGIFDVDRICLFQIKEGEKVWDITNEWFHKGMKSLKKKLRKIPSDNFSWWVREFKRKQALIVSDVENLPDQALSGMKKFKEFDTKSILVIPLYFENQLFGALGLFKSKEPRVWLQDDIRIVKASGEIIATSLVKERIQKKLTKTLEELDTERKRMVELAKRTIDAQERERLYLASEIHDDMLQGLVAILYFFQMIDTSSLGTKMQKRKEKLIEIIKSSIDRGRALISEIEPIREPEVGLIEAIKKAIDMRFAGADVKMRFTFPEELPKIDFAAKANILRIMQEALMNVRKHAYATRLSVKIAAPKNGLKIEIKDNGVGFRPKSATKKSTRHYGLLTMQERAHLVGGELTVMSKLGKGTIVRGIFPLNGR